MIAAIRRGHLHHFSRRCPQMRHVVYLFSLLTLFNQGEIKCFRCASNVTLEGQ